MKSAQQKIKRFVRDNHLEIKPEYRALDIVAETGDIAKEVLRATEFGAKESAFKEEIRHEMGELLFSLICLANTYDVDLEKTLDEVLIKYRKKIEESSKFR